MQAARCLAWPIHPKCRLGDTSICDSVGAQVREGGGKMKRRGDASLSSLSVVISCTTHDPSPPVATICVHVCTRRFCVRALHAPSPRCTCPLTVFYATLREAPGLRLNSPGHSQCCSRVVWGTWRCHCLLCFWVSLGMEEQLKGRASDGGDASHEDEHGSKLAYAPVLPTPHG
jgi:hypothetical protein